jgi:hypothetical protein
MSRFPRVGDYIKFEQLFTVNLGDLGSGPLYIDIPKNTICEVLDTHITKDDKRSSMIDYAPFQIYLGITDKNISPHKFIIRFNYLQHQEIVSIIPGGNPKTVETLFGQNES